MRGGGKTTCTKTTAPPPDELPEKTKTPNQLLKEGEVTITKKGGGTYGKLPKNKT